MAKQKCGTCRFFQDAGLAGSGWCHHPLRKVSSGVMIMVRQNELACRDEWYDSLWSPSQDSGESGKKFQRPLTFEPAPPANVESVRKLLFDDAIASVGPAQGEDVLLSEGRLVSEILDAPANKERPIQSGGFDPRTAVFRAREAYRERSRARETAARLSAGAEAHQYSRDDRADDSRSNEVDAALKSRSLDGGLDDVVAHPQRKQVQREIALTDADGTQSAPTRHFSTDWEVAKPTESGVAPVMATSKERSPTVSSERGSEAIPLPPQVARQSNPVEETVDEPDATPLPEWFRTDLPRMCRTCRDFRPSADGERGSCANAWAFTHRRLVKEDDLAPCDSSIGDWWAPVDDVWLVAADVASHGRATPLLDRMIAPQSDRRRRS